MPRTLKYLALIILMTAALPAAAHAATVPLNASTNGTAHLYRQATTLPAGYTSLPLAGYIETTGPLPDRLMQLTKNGQRTYTDDTTAGGEYSQLIAQGWTSAGTVGYTLPPDTPDTLPTYRLEKTGDVLLTGDWIEKDKLVADGWTVTGTLGNLTQSRCLPWVTNNTTPTNSVDGHLAADWEAADPFKVFRAVESQPCAPGHGIHVVTAPRREGTYAAWNQLQPGDKIGNLNGERASAKISRPQLGYAPTLPEGSMEGSERWFGWSIMLPTGFNLDLTQPVPKGSMILTAFHHGVQADENACADPIILTAQQLSSTESQWKVRVTGGVPANLPNSCGSYQTEYAQLLGPLTRNVWTDFVVHAKFCYDDNCAENGLVELWKDGVKVTEVHGPNMYKDEALTVHWPILYRPLVGANSQPTEAYFDGWKMGSSYAEVAP